MTPADRCDVNRLNGIHAELRVAENYQRCGFTLLEQRYRKRSGEIDLIFKHKERLYFVEVKRGPDHATALSYIQPNQIARIQKTVFEYLAQHDLPLETDMRLDAVSYTHLTLPTKA